MQGRKVHYHYLRHHLTHNKMIRQFSKTILKWWGFKIVGDPGNHLRKRLFVVIPHTSNWDFPLGLLLRSACNIQVEFVGKDSLFKPPFGWIFKRLGGHPVDRSKRNNFVEAVVDIFNSKDRLAIAMAPEGTRSRVDKLKTGFYHIARLAEIPMILTKFDFGNKELVFSPPVYTTEDQDKDFQLIYDFFKGVQGKNPENSFIAPTEND